MRQLSSGQAFEGALPLTLRRHQQVLALLDQVRTVLPAAADLPALCSVITASLHEVFGYPLVSIVLVEDGKMKPLVSVGYQLKGVHYPLDYGIAGRVARSGKAALVPDVRQDPDYRVYRSEVISQLCLPLSDGEQVVGLLNIETTDAVLTEEDLQLMELLTQHLSSAVQRLRRDLELSADRERDQQLYAEITRQASELALLHQVRNALSREGKVGEIIAAVNLAIVNAFGYTQVSTYLIQNADLVLQHQIGYHHVLDQLPLGSGVMGRVVRTGQAELIEDVRLEPQFLGAIDNITSEVTVPLRCQGKVTGLLNVESVNGVTLQRRDLHLMVEIAAQLEQALERAQLIETLQLSEARYRLLAESMTDLVCLHAPDGTLLYVSPSVTGLLGYAPDDVIGTSPLAFFHPEDRACVQGQVRDRQPPQLDRLRLRLRHRGGHWLWFEISSAPVPSEGGQWQSTSRDISERQHIEQQLAWEAQHDPLTGLANRTLFERRLQQQLTLAQRGKPQYAVLFLDVNRFKVINDSLGHRVGDELLRAMAERLALCLPPGELLCRLGGDEFAILIRGGAAEAERLARHLTKKFKTPLSVGQYELQVSVSIGIAPGRPEYTEPGDVLRDADLSMYDSKQRQGTRGGLAYTVFDRSLHERAVRRLHIEAELGSALKTKQLKLFYQPVVRLSDKRLLGFEALARWVHPELGPVNPLEFLGVAEETGLIWPLGQWVLEEACTQLSAWQRSRPGTALSLNVNISPQQFQQTDLVRQVQRAISKSGCCARGLNIEITEGAMLQGSAAQTIAALRQLGVGVQVDDFGTGYSSLASLHRFDITTLKIDRLFVDNLTNDPASQGVVQAILTLAEALKLEVIAEGVETEQQRFHLLDLGCQVAQGYLFAPALNAEAATRLWRQGQADSAAQPVAALQAPRAGR